MVEYTVLEFKQNVDDIHHHVILPQITNGTKTREKKRTKILRKTCMKRMERRKIIKEGG